MMATYTLQLKSGSHRLSATIEGRTFELAFCYRKAALGGWFMDISLADGSLGISGIPVVRGQNLLSQHEYLGFGSLTLDPNGVENEHLEYDDIGQCKLIWET